MTRPSFCYCGESGVTKVVRNGEVEGVGRFVGGRIPKDERRGARSSEKNGLILKEGNKS